MVAVNILAVALLAAGLVQSTPFRTAHFKQTPLVPELADTVACNCSGTRDQDDPRYICGDSRLGPVQLPTKFPLLGVVSTYDRLGGHSPAGFLSRWTNEDGGWLWPPADGFLTDDNNKPILANATLQIGTRLDRFGGVYGRYLAAAEAPFDQRSLPPSSLNEDPANPDWPFGYHVYEVIKPLPVLAGLIAPWFGQPGLGAQFWTGYLGNVKFLMEQGYIIEDKKSKLPDPGDGSGGRCG